MNRETETALIERLLAHHEAGTTSTHEGESRIAIEAYRSDERFEAEKRALFRRRPIVVAHASELASPGDCMTHDALGVPLVVTRDREGGLRAFLNVCRHRGSRIVLEERSQKKAFVCGYHGWTYGLDGALFHVPHPDGFTCANEERGLVPVPVAERGGFVWVMPEARATMNVDDFLGPLASELDGLGLARHVVHRASTTRRRFNWKLLIDAFLDGYHLKTLHRNSVYKFFYDNVNIADAFGPHIRSAVARKGLERAKTIPRADWRYRDFLSLTYFLFPNTVLVFHPDWVSRMTLFPASVGETDFVHAMLIAPEDATEEKRAHWDKTWGLIHETVFEREDIAAAERIQSGLDSGANDAFVLGRYEFPIRWFHDSIERAL
jgi:phenylpropionate dioxygenase-like ring-hydroxylating dioxygenase large terminal subunit